MSSTSASPVHLEQLVYGWSPSGREGSNRFQVVSCSSAFASSLETNGRLSETAKKLCYLNARHEPDAVSTGWVRAGGGTFVFRRQPTGPDSWGRSGGFSAHVVYARRHLDSRETLDVVNQTAWLNVEQAVALGVDLPLAAIGGSESSLEPRGEGRHVPELIEAVLASGLDGRRIVLAMPWTDALETLSEAATHLPVDIFAASSFSTYEVGKDEVERFAICGVPDPDLAALAGARVVGGVTPSNSESNRLSGIGQITVGDPEAVGEALALAVDAAGEFSVGAYSATLQMISGGRPTLDVDLVAALYTRPTATAMALRHLEPAEQVVGVTLDAWQRLGPAFCEMVGLLPDQTADAAVTLLADRFVHATAVPRRPDVLNTVNAVAPAELSRFVDALVAALDRRPDAAGPLPRVTLSILLANWPSQDVSGDVFRSLCAAAFDGRVVEQIEGRIQTRVLVVLVLGALDRADRASIVHLLSGAAVTQLGDIATAIARRTSWRADLDWIAHSDAGGAILPVLDVWGRSKGRSEFAVTSRLHRMSTVGVEAASDELLRLVSSQELFAYDDRRRAAEIAERTYPARVQRRVRAGQPQPLRRGDRVVVRALQHHSERLTAWSAFLDEIAVHAAPGRRGTALDAALDRIEAGLRHVHQADRHMLIALAVEPMVPRLRTADQAREVIEAITDWFGGDRAGGLETVIGLAHGALVGQPTPQAAVPAKAIFEAAAGATQRGRFQRSVVISDAAVGQARSLEQLGSVALASAKKPLSKKSSKKSKR